MQGILHSFIDIYLAFGLSLLVFSGYIFLHVSSDIMKNIEYISFKMFIVAFQVYVIFANIQTLQEYGIIHLSAPIYKTAMLLMFLSLSFTVFCYYMVMMEHFEVDTGNNRAVMIIGIVPFAAIAVLLIISIFNGLLFDIDAGRHIIEGPAYYLIHIIISLYFLVILRVAVLNSKTKGTARAKRRAINTFLITLFLIFWVIIDDKLHNATVIPVAIFAVIFYTFINIQQENIYTDALTGMNNRRRAEMFLGEEIKNATEDDPVYLFMGDINGFKQINDEYGHYEGDCALMIFSDAVKKSAEAYNGFAARYGGDEFVWAWRPTKSGDTDPDMVMADIRHRVEAECKAQKRPYVLSLSLGCILCTDPTIKVSQYLKEADRKMYANKQGHYRANR